MEKVGPKYLLASKGTVKYRFFSKQKLKCRFLGTPRIYWIQIFCFWGEGVGGFWELDFNYLRDMGTEDAHQPTWKMEWKSKGCVAGVDNTFI